jgi:hypothetical protein
MAFEPGTEFDRSVAAVGSARYVMTYGPKSPNRAHDARWELSRQRAGVHDTFDELHANVSSMALEAWAADLLEGTAANPTGIANGLVVDFLIGRPSVFAGDPEVADAE